MRACDWQVCPTVTSDSVLAEESLFVVRDWLPAAWEGVNVSVPVRAAHGAPVSWVDVSIRRVASGKTITVANCPLSSLRIEAWLEGHALAAASPPGYSVDEADRVAWSWEGRDGARGASVTLTW